ncbi:MAG: Molecular chaperone GroES [Promethearchaeota archaeon]|nr:MAG: Molecular chaperone GroES [Candidatus Lokiarchaeota archaeon]
MPTKMTQSSLELLDDTDPSGMRVAILEEPYKIRLARAKIPKPGEEEVLVKIKYVGICGSDVEAYRGTRAPEFISLPTRLGHEVAGVIEEVGKNVMGLKKGDKVCLRYAWGAFAEYMCCKPFNIKVLPPKFHLLDISLIEILPGVIHTAELAKINPSKNVLIMGQGVSGLVLTQVISLYSPKNLVVTDLFDKKLHLAKKYGATHTYKLANSKEQTMDYLGKEFPEGFDIVIPCLLEGDGVADAIECVAQNGIIVLYGCIGICNTPLDFFKVHRKRTAIISTEPRRDIDMRRYFEEGVQLVREGLVNTKEMITHILPLSEIQKAFTLREKHQEEVIHVIIDCER